jgi:hypothetical protein
MQWEFSENLKYVLTNLLTVSRGKIRPWLLSQSGESIVIEAVFAPIMPATFVRGANLATDDSPCPLSE